MSEFKGTKGKWYHDKGTLSIWHSEIIGQRLACVDNSIRGEVSEEEEANALLISKAPEMLEMLQIVCTELYKTDNELATKVKQLIKEATEL